MNPLYVVLALIPIAIAFRYFMEQSQAARLIGIRMASPEYLRINKNGHQNAISIPEANKWFFLLIALLIGGLVLLLVNFGFLWALAGLAAVMLSSAFAQVLFLPKKDSQHFFNKIFDSMSRRHADYERNGDKLRAEAMRDMLRRIVEAYPSLRATTTQTTEKIINKSDADHIFSLNRAQWEHYAERMVHPAGWEIRRFQRDTGTAVGAFDPATGMGHSTQPLYTDASSTPQSIVIGTYYPVGKLLDRLTPERKAELERASQADLGGDYTVTVRYFSQPPLEGIEFHVMRSVVS